MYRKISDYGIIGDMHEVISKSSQEENSNQNNGILKILMY